MNKRSLGRSGLEVAPLAFGGNVFGWTADEATSFRLLDQFVDAGFNLIDTADVYSRWVPGHKGGESETIIGKWLKKSGKREKVVLATKVGMELGPDKKGLAPAYIKSALEESLRRLQTDYIDLYQAHTDDTNTPLFETLGAFDGLVKAGKVRAIGASNFSAARLAEALRVSTDRDLARYESLQPLYNLYDRAPYEAELRSVCVEQGVGVINYYSLASGFLSGKYRGAGDLSKSPRGQRVKEYLNNRGYRILETLDAVAKEAHATCAQVALAWLMTRPGITAPIASATSEEQMSELLGSVRVELNREALRRLDAASAP
ncbi:MAG: aldo/keto reductase [Burkholderiaceae bacterium]|jgi:aryl-alcohol dehydrogenase-like predicted oxidoreductase